MKAFGIMIGLCAAMGAAWGQSPEPLRAGRTTLAMTSDIVNGIAAPPGPSRVRVPPGEQVQLMLSEAIGLSDPPTEVQWTKDGEPIPGATKAILALGAVTTKDSGLYRVTPNLPFPFTWLGIRLDVVPQGNLANVSARVELRPGNDIQILGFVVGGTQPKWMLLRAVGPSLGVLGVTKPAKLPRIRLYDSRDNLYSEARIPEWWMNIDWAELFSRAGAFALTGGERLEAMADYLLLPPGAYTMHVSDDAGEGGTVLMEAYEVP